MYITKILLEIKAICWDFFSETQKLGQKKKLSQLIIVH